MEITSNPFLYLADSIANSDQRQDAYLALLEQNPKTEQAANAILSGIHHKAEWDQRQYRKKNMQLNFDPPAPQADECGGIVMSALDRLPDADRLLIAEHVIEGESLRDIALRRGVSKDTIRKRFDRAAEKLRAICK